jgi:SAM-dependent methyltransferase
MNGDLHAVGTWSALAPREFVETAYAFILRRPPTAVEREQMLAALLQGDTRTWLLGLLRYGDEGRRCGVQLDGLHSRYLAQRLFRVPLLGPVLEWINAVVRLPSSFRYFRSVSQIDAETRSAARRADEDRIADVERRHAQVRNDLENVLFAVDRLRSDLDGVRTAVDQTRGALAEAREDAGRMRNDIARMRADVLADFGAALDRNASEVAAAMERIRTDHAALADMAKQTQSDLAAISPPPLDDTLEVIGSPLAALARERAGLPAASPIPTLAPDRRYSMFESIFYESPAVAAKQRVYLPYLNRELTSQFPVLDLGCGRGEFLRILQESFVRGIGVDINRTGLAKLRDDGFDVIESDLVEFLERDTATYSAIVMLQVAEHLDDDELDRMLTLAAARVAPGGTLILETPNPLSPFALAVFHTDATHVRPLPPERLRYSIEAAGFEQARTLFQARIPRDQFAGPDPRAYYADYAIIAIRSSI